MNWTRQFGEGNMDRDDTGLLFVGGRCESSSGTIKATNFLSDSEALENESAACCFVTFSSSLDAKLISLTVNELRNWCFFRRSYKSLL